MESNYVDVIPYHDFIGVFFVSSIDETTLYAVVPRFWHTNITDELRSFNGINLRILTQNKPTKLPQSEADAVTSQMNRIKKIYSEETTLNGDDEMPVFQQTEDSYEEVEIIKALLVLCEFYNTKNRKNHILRFPLPEIHCCWLQKLFKHLKRIWLNLLGRTVKSWRKQTL